MDKFDELANSVVNQVADVPVLAFGIDLLLTAFLTYVLSQVYIRYGRSLSNRQLFSKNFILLGMTTMVIITIVKSSLALSLGLVGALSIIRFRTAIKDPEELTYMFLSIAVGLGFGANQRAVTIIGAFAAMIAIRFVSQSHKKDHTHNLFVTVSSSNRETAPSLDVLVDTLKKHAKFVELKRHEVLDNSLESTFQIGFGDFKDLKSCEGVLKKITGIQYSFLDNTHGLL